LTKQPKDLYDTAAWSPESGSDIGELQLKVYKQTNKMKAIGTISGGKQKMT
jgi:hypothetical protein